MSKHALDLTSLNIPRARKGDAAPVAAAPEPTPSAPPMTPDPGPATEPRTTVSTRLTVAMQERMRRYAFHSRKAKQDIFDEALEAHLKAKGF
jgi:hypothetical protein